MKAYRGVDNRIRLFRPEMNMSRMRKTAARSALPVSLNQNLLGKFQCNESKILQDFDSNELIKIICELVRIDKQWVPYSNTSSLYIRPTMIGTDVS